jgi:molybdopterin-guanine dinucleotide biosynthesis protein A
MLGALILTGGASSRMGADKARLDWGGVRAVDLVAARAREAGAAPILTVGAQDLGLPNVKEPAPGGGPVAGLAAGAEVLRRDGVSRALVLAVDAPTIRAADLVPLLAASSPGAAYVGLQLPVVIELAAVPPQAGAGWSMTRLLDAVGVSRLHPAPSAAARLRGANTPEEREALLAAYLGEGPATE